MVGLPADRLIWCRWRAVMGLLIPRGSSVAPGPERDRVGPGDRCGLSADLLAEMAPGRVLDKPVRVL